MPTNSDRELRDRLEALEAEVKRLTQAQALVHHVLARADVPVLAVDEKEVRVLAWFGRQTSNVREAISFLLVLFLVGLPVSLLVTQEGTAPLPLVAYLALWMVVVMFAATGVMRGAALLHAVREHVRR